MILILLLSNHTGNAMIKSIDWALVEQNFTFLWTPGPNINKKDLV